MRTIPEYDSLLIGPPWQFYEAAKIALAELEAIPPDASPVDWSFIEQRKAAMRAEIADFEQRFPSYKRPSDDLVIAEYARSFLLVNYPRLEVESMVCHRTERNGGALYPGEEWECRSTYADQC